MRRLVTVCLLAACSGCIAFGQVAAVPQDWIGTWATLDGDNLDIAATSSSLTFTLNSQIKLDLKLDGSETASLEGSMLSYHRIDDLTFDVTIRSNNKVEKIRFLLSADGNSLRETQNRTSRVFQKLLFAPPAGRVFLRPIER